MNVSLEGKYLWILREAPLAENSLLWAKVGFQLLLSLPCTVIAGVCLTLALELPPWQGGALLLYALIFAVGQAVFGMLMGLLFPKLDAVVVKQSLAVLLAMFIPMAVLALCGLLYWAGGFASPALGVALPLALLTVFTAACTALLFRFGPSILQKL